MHLPLIELFATRPLPKAAAAVAAALALSLAALVSANAALAQSFSCSEANLPSEMAVCNSEALLVLDEKLSAMASQKLSRTNSKPGRQALNRDQQNWVLARNKCGADPVCLELRYNERMAQMAGAKPVASFVRFSQRQPNG